MKLRITHHSPAYWRATFDNPPLNLLDPEVAYELRELINQMETSKELKVIVFDSADPAWIFGLADDEYQRCSPAHVATGATHSPDGRRMAINVEVLGGSVLVSHFTEEITDKHHVRLASVSDSFTPTGRTTLQVIWDMSVKAIDTNKCQFTNYVHSKPTEEFLEFLAKQGIPFEQFKQARQPVSEAHNRQETPLFAASIERAAQKKR